MAQDRGFFGGVGGGNGYGFGEGSRKKRKSMDVTDDDCYDESDDSQNDSSGEQKEDIYVDDSSIKQLVGLAKSIAGKENIQLSEAISILSLIVSLWLFNGNIKNRSD
jgi:hypothetical protein